MNILAIYLLIFTVFFNSAFAKEMIKGRVIKVADGDTLTILVDRKKTRIRLAEIDCPEKEQPWGKEATLFLKKRVLGKEIIVEKLGIDDYKRTIGKVFFGNKNINYQLVEQGHCWVYRKYSKNKLLINLEKKAKKKKRGLWSLPKNQKVPPWIYRKIKRNKSN